jgi:glucokinase
MGLVAGVDIGGTNIAVGLVDDDHEVVDEVEVDTPTDGPDAVVEAVAEALDDLDDDAEAIGVGAPGPVSDGVLLSAPNLAGFTEPAPLAERLADATGLPVTLGNDASLGVVGEWVAGAARGYRSVLGIWLGTGVGGGLVVDGRPYDGVFGSAGEFGHVVIREGGALCGCSRRGCVEAYAGRASMERQVEVAVAAGRPTQLYEIMEEAGKDRITSKVWKAALEQEDPLATRLIDEAIHAVGVALGAAVNLLDLDCVVVGGGLAEKLGQDLADRIAAAAEPWILASDADRHVVVAELGDHSGMVGAARAARELAEQIRNAALPG